MVAARPTLQPMPTVMVVLTTTSYRAADFVDAAERLGVNLVVATEEMIPSLDQDGMVEIDCDNPTASAEKVLEWSATRPIDAIVSADDRGLETAARVAESLGLPHHGLAGVRASLNKAETRRRLSQSEVPQPKWRMVEAGDQAGDAMRATSSSVVVKPLSLSASQGVIRVDHVDQIDAVCQRVRSIIEAEGGGPGAPVLIEEFIPGPEVAVEAMATSGRVEVLAVFDKPDAMDGPFFEETIYVTPSSLSPAILAEVERMTAAAAAALDLRQGPIHAELRISDDRVFLIEIAARSIGGVCSRSLGFGLAGTSLEMLILREALGNRRPLPKMAGASGVMMLPIPGRGTLSAVNGVEACRAVAGVTELEISIPIGGRVVPLPEGNRYLGFLLARGSTPDEVVASLRDAHSRLEFVLV